VKAHKRKVMYATNVEIHSTNLYTQKNMNSLYTPHMHVSHRQRLTLELLLDSPFLLAQVREPTHSLSKRQSRDSLPSDVVFTCVQPAQMKEEFIHIADSKRAQRGWIQEENENERPTHVTKQHAIIKNRSKLDKQFYHANPNQRK
jgi:DNA-binding transcriptional regulator YbjK